MSFLRRRLFQRKASEPTPSPDSSAESTPARTPHPDDLDSKDDLRVVSAKKLEKLRHPPRQVGRKRRNALKFGLGGVFGMVVAGFFAGNNDMLPGLDLASLADFNLESIFDVLPMGLIKDAQDMQKKERDAVNYDSFAIGLHAQSQGVRAKHPVIMIPGVISTGLESWGTEDEDSRQYFRKRLWGSWSMMRALVLDKAAWKRKIMLDKRTGLDPPGAKLRAAQGFDAADFFITGYWIWSKILENLATIGYDPGNAFTAAYDWRLAYNNLEVRDAYFTRLKAHIELAVRLSGKKVVLLSHSMGSQVLYYFLHWVEAPGEGFGNGGEHWVDTFVDSWINISGCMLGAVKGVPAVLSGEMKDTAQMNAFALYGLDKFLSRNERGEIFRAMPGISSMLPMGGDAVWGNATWAPDDQPGQETSFGAMVAFHDGSHAQSPNPFPAPPDAVDRDASNPFPQHRHPAVLTADAALPFLLNHTEAWYADAVNRAYSYGVAHTAAELDANARDPRKWLNPLETRLPRAPDLKIYCFYGVGKPTERAYFYKRDPDPASLTGVVIDTGVSSAGLAANVSGGGGEGEQRVIGNGRETEKGVVMGEGDGTVNLLSSGYMCNRGWRMRRYNPAGARVTVYEMPHEPDRFSPRGGPNTGDHVDILGRSSLNDLILRVAGGKGDLIEETVHSNIREYAQRVKIYDDDEGGEEAGDVEMPVGPAEKFERRKGGEAPEL